MFMVPALDETPWPTLGPQVINWMEGNLVHGPGDLKGDPLRLTDLWRAILTRAYEVYPVDHPRAGRRRFKKVVVVLRKGLAKSEIGGCLAITEAHPGAPVRTIGWTEDGQPVGGGVRNPYVPMVAYTDEQSEELGYGAAKAILDDPNCPLGGAFDVKNESIDVIIGDGAGTIVHLSSSPSARDGARTTFCFKDEIHHWDSPRLRKTDKVLDGNLHKRMTADPWSFEVTTMHEPGADSVSELRFREAKAIHDGTLEDPPDDLLYIWIGADGTHDLDTFEGFDAAIRQVSGEAYAWTDVDGLWGQWRRSEDKTWMKRVWLNMEVTPEAKWIQAARWDALADPSVHVGEGERICLGFDGSRTGDSTYLVACRLTDGHTWPIRSWNPSETGVEVPLDEVNNAVSACFETYDVVRMACDPFLWNTIVAEWQGRWGDRVVSWPTNRQKAMAFALKATAEDIAAEEFTHNGDLGLRRHVLAAMREPTQIILDLQTGERGYRLAKPPEGDQIDGAIAFTLAHEARREAITAGGLEALAEPGVFFGLV